MVLPLEFILEVAVAIAAFVSFGVIPVARQMMLQQRRYPGSRAPGFVTPTAYLPLPGFFGIITPDPPVQLQYSPISVLERPKAAATPTSPSIPPSASLIDLGLDHATPTLTSRPHPSQAPPANPDHASPASTSLPTKLARALNELTDRPLARKVKQWWSTSRIAEILHFVLVFLPPRVGLAALFLQVIYNLLGGAAQQDRNGIRGVVRGALRVAGRM